MSDCEHQNTHECHECYSNQCVDCAEMMEDHWRKRAVRAEARVEELEIEKDKVELILLTAFESLITGGDRNAVCQYIQINFGKELIEHTKRRAKMIPITGPAINGRDEEAEREAHHALTGM